MNRRQFIQSLAIAGSSVPIIGQPAITVNQCSYTGAVSEPLKSKIEGMKRVYCTAFIDPTIPVQQGQEATVANYPLALIPQDSRAPFIAWKDAVKAINPDIVFLAYQNVQSETIVPGPGHDVLRASDLVDDFWCYYPDGTAPTVLSSGKYSRLYDYRKPGWKQVFLNACSAVLSS